VNQLSKTLPLDEPEMLLTQIECELDINLILEQIKAVLICSTLPNDEAARLCQGVEHVRKHLRWQTRELIQTMQDRRN